MRPLLSVILVSSLTACPFGGGPTTCTLAVENAMQSATGRVSQNDAGTLVTLQWPAPATPTPLPLEYFQGATLHGAQGRENRFEVTSTTGAEAQFGAVDGGFSFAVTFPEPDRLGLGGCKGSHGGMDDRIELEVQVADAGVSTSANIALGAY